MNNPTRHRGPVLPLDVLNQIDGICGRFEAAWEAGDRPRVEDYLGDVDEVYRSALLHDLLAAELAARRRRGERLDPDEYHERFPADATLIDYALRECSEPPGAEPGEILDSASFDLAKAFFSMAEMAERTRRSETLSATLGRGTQVRRFGDFELLQILGQGGMGVVYRARQKSLNRMVAIKMIRSGAWASDDEVRRFRNEAEAVANLDHPQIVTIHEVGEHGGRHYFSMKLVDGPSLSKMLSRYSADTRAAARLVSEVALAVHHAHQRGILHRDLKPSNILLDAEGRAHVTDFGLAKKIESGGDLSISGSLMGTPSYMSPEQASGSRSSVTTATDIHGLGAVLYAMLTGRPPYEGASVAETLERVLVRPPDRPRLVNHQVPPDLETICLKCLEKDPKRRYNTAASLADDLDRFLRGEAILARPVSRIEAIWRGCRRNPVVATLGVMVAAFFLASAVVGTVAALWYKEAALREAGLRGVADHARAKAEESAAKETEAVTSLKSSLYFHRIALAHHDWLLSNVGQADQRLGECDPDLRHWEWRYLKRLCHSELMELSGHHEMVRGIAFSPDGLRLASVDANWGQPHPGELKTWDLTSGKGQLTSIAHASGAFGVAFSPDGRRLASGGHDGTVRVFDATTGQHLAAHHVSGGPAYGVAFSPSGKYLASAHADKTVRIWDTSGRKDSRELTGHRDNVFCVTFSADGKYLASGSRDGTVRIWEPDSGRIVLVLNASADVRCAAFSPDGSRIAAGTYASKAKVWDLAGREIFTSRSRAQVIYSIAFSPDGRRLASGDSDGLVSIWDPNNGDDHGSLRGHTGPVLGVAFSRDGCRLATAGGDRAVRVWDLTTGQESRTVGPANLDGWTYRIAFSPNSRWIASYGGLAWARPAKGIRFHDVAPGRFDTDLQDDSRSISRLAQETVTAVAWHPGGKRLATGGEDKIVRLWDVATGREVFSAPVSAALITDLAFSSDGQILVWTSLDGLVRACDVGQGQTPQVLGKHSGAALGVTFRSDLREVVSAGADGSLKCWDATRGGESRKLHGFATAISLPAFGAEGRLCAAIGGEGSIQILDPESGQESIVPHPHSAAITALSFSLDGNRLASSSEDQTVKIWDTNTGHEALILRLHREHVKSVAFSPDGHYLASSCHMIEVCDAEPTDQARGFRVREAAARVANWHLAQVYASRSERNWLAMIHHLDQLIACQPGRWFNHGWRAWVKAECREWEQASAGFARAIELGPTNVDIYYAAALLRLREGDLRAYRAICESASTRFGKERNIYTLNYLARTCTLAPFAIGDQEKPVRWARDEMSHRPRNPDSLYTLGTTLYRAGRYEEAVRQLEQAVAIRGHDGNTFDRLYLAMSNSCLGREEMARAWLKKAVAALDRPGLQGSPDSSEPVPAHWNNEIELAILRHEAETLILAPDLPVDPFSH